MRGSESDLSPFQHRIAFIFECNEPKLKLYARWRISLAMHGKSRGDILPGGLDCDDIVYSSITYALMNFKEDEILNNPRKFSEEEEVYRKLKRRIDTVIKNSLHSKERFTTLRAEDVTLYGNNENVVSILESIPDRNNANPEDLMIYDDFVRYTSIKTQNKIVIDLANIIIYNGIVSSRDQSNELNVPVNIIYEARVELKDLLEDFLGYRKRRKKRTRGKEG